MARKIGFEDAMRKRWVMFSRAVRLKLTLQIGLPLHPVYSAANRCLARRGDCGIVAAFDF